MRHAYTVIVECDSITKWKYIVVAGSAEIAARKAIQRTHRDWDVRSSLRASLVQQLEGDVVP